MLVGILKHRFQCASEKRETLISAKMLGTKSVSSQGTLSNPSLIIRSKRNTVVFCVLPARHSDVGMNFGAGGVGRHVQCGGMPRDGSFVVAAIEIKE